MWTERYEWWIWKFDCDMTAYLQTHFNQDIVRELSRQWKNECELYVWFKRFSKERRVVHRKFN